MAVPKSKVSRQRRDKRRSSVWKLEAPAIVKCPNCGAYHLPHRACKACGQYNGRVVFAVEEFEAVPGLPESVFFTEGFAFLNDLLFSGILFCLLPTLFLVPRLYGKIEPLLGMKPRTAEDAPEVPSAKLVLGAVACFVVAVLAACLSKAGFSLIEWEAEWAESTGAIFTGLGVAAVIAIVAAFCLHRNATLSRA